MTPLKMLLGLRHHIASEEGLCRAHLHGKPRLRGGCSRSSVPSRQIFSHVGVTLGHTLAAVRYVLLRGPCQYVGVLPSFFFFGVGG
jgi:hypothetical protein